MSSAGEDLLRFAGSRRFSTVLADPPWQFTNKTGKVAPEHKRLSRYGTMKLDEITALPVADICAPTSHAGAGPAPGQSAVDAQARTLAQARRAVRDHRGVLAGSVRRTVRPRHAQALGHLGQSGRRGLQADVEDLRASFEGRAGRGGVRLTWMFRLHVPNGSS
jgi:hypothetical protein